MSVATLASKAASRFLNVWRSCRSQTHRTPASEMWIPCLLEEVLSTGPTDGACEPGPCLPGGQICDPDARVCFDP